MIRVLLVDDHELMRAGLRSRLEREDGIVVVGEADTAERAVVLARRLQPDMILLDLLMPRKSGYEAIPELADVAPQAKVLVVSSQAAPSSGSVDLMTIHGAKGLEWDIVMVPGLARQAGISRSGLLVWNQIEEPEPDAAHGMLAPIAGRGEPAKKLNQWMKSLRDAREAAERKRLFYVACTRARATAARSATTRTTAAT